MTFYRRHLLTMSLSLQATRIRNILFRALRDSVDLDTRQFSDDFVYSNPSITQLAEYLVSVAQGALTPGDVAASRVDAMHKMVQKYSNDFPNISQSRVRTLEAGKIALVTGTTGGARVPHLSESYLGRNRHSYIRGEQTGICACNEETAANICRPWTGC